jgi:ABC-type multidrug transport system ATPase subunit
MTRNESDDRPSAVRTSQLSKRFDGQPVVDAIDLEVGVGEIFGLLGPNGSGKSTTLRMLTGLLRPSAGDIEVLGADPGTQPRRVGAVIEEPALYPYLSGRRNLLLLAGLVGASPQEVDERLELVGLGDAADRRAGGYSTGMRQRLGIAAALLHDPDLLILDEPSAGLDPSGVVEIRRLLRELGGGDRTIIVSSHQLTEIDRICDRVAIINRGGLAYQGEIDELRHDQATEGLRARVDPRGSAIRVLDALGIDCTEDGDDLTIDAGPDRAPEIVRELVAADVDVFELRERHRSLEEAYMELTA